MIKMASPTLLDIPYFIGPVADRIISRRAKKLKATADSTLFWKNAAQNDKNAKTMGKFYDVLVDQAPASYKSNAVKLKERAAKGTLPENCSLSIALSGGGLRVVAFLAFLETLREHNVPIRAYAGTSAGALATMLDRIGVDYKTAWECLDEKMLKSLLFSLNANLGMGILSGGRMIRFIEQVLPDDLKTYKQMPFLYTTSVLVNSWNKWTSGVDKKGKNTVEGAPDSLSTYKKIVFSSEFDPDMRISKGVFSSMCLPVFQSLRFPKRKFTSIMEDCSTKEVMSTEKGWTIDGGYANNYPVDVLLLSGSANTNLDTRIVINVAADNPNNTEIRKQDLIQKLAFMAPGVSNAEELEREKARYADSNAIWWTIGGKAAGIELFDFQKIDVMRQAGRESAEGLLRTVGIMQ